MSPMAAMNIVADVRRESQDDAAYTTEATMPERRQEALFQAIATVDVKHDAAHKRLREDFRELEEKMSEALQIIRERQQENRNKIDQIATSPTNVEKLILTPKVVISMVIFAIATTGGVWSANYGIRSEMAALRSDMRDVITRMETQKTSFEAGAKLQEVQANALKTSVDDMKRRQELQQYEIQGLKEAIITGKPRAAVR